MANFGKALVKITIYEGGYVDDFQDPGGETYNSIARNYNPSWLGWRIIDSYKNGADFPKVLDKDKELQELVTQLQKDKYWNPYRGDNLSQLIAGEMLDQAIHFGADRAIGHFQRTLNILNRNQHDWQDLEVDMKFGDKTFNNYTKAVARRGEKLIFNVLNGFQISRYIKLMESSPVKEKYIGWFGRIEIIK